MTIYEGTTAIQGNDLIGRKILANSGKVISDLLVEMSTEVDAIQVESLESAKASVQAAIANVEDTVHWILENAKDPQVANTIGSNMLMALGFLCGGWLLLKSGVAAEEGLKTGAVTDELANNKLAVTRFFCNHFVPRVFAYTATVKAGKEDIFAIGEEAF